MWMKSQPCKDEAAAAEAAEDDQSVDKLVEEEEQEEARRSLERSRLGRRLEAQYRRKKLEEEGAKTRGIERLQALAVVGDARRGQEDQEAREAEETGQNRDGRIGIVQVVLKLPVEIEGQMARGEMAYPTPLLAMQQFKRQDGGEMTRLGKETNQQRNRKRRRCCLSQEDEWERREEGRGNRVSGDVEKRLRSKAAIY